MGMTAALQGAMYRARKRRIARQLLQSCTPWSAGLNVLLGEFVTTANGTILYRAQNSGTTGPTSPTGFTAFDGGVHWTLADNQSLLPFAYVGVPTP